MTDKPRLIEHAFPLKQASLNSVHEKNVRHGHISTLHIWPARRPLAACRAALIATLLPDPGTPEERQELCERIGGKVVQQIEKKKMPGGRSVDRIKEETGGGILHWMGSVPTSGGKKKKDEHRRKAEFYEGELEWIRQEIRKAYDGRAPRVLDPFAGGGAIPLEAMRLGCEVTAVDINPVAWFILKCTLEYPQKLAGKTHPLPEFILEDEEFMKAFYKAHPQLVGKAKQTKSQAREFQNDLFRNGWSDSGQAPEADLAWQVRAWGKWMLGRARQDLAKYYPTYADFEPLKPGKAYEKQSMRLVPPTDIGTPDIGALNVEFSDEYLSDPKNPRWIAKPTVAYFWARTVTCKNCRATLPLLKTRWLCKKDAKRVILTMEANPGKTGVVFGIEADVPVKGGNAAQKREHDKRIGSGTMSRTGAWCPCCQKPGQVIMTMEDIRLEGRAQRLGAVMTAVVVDDRKGKEYRLPTEHELRLVGEAEKAIPGVFDQIPFGLPEEPLPSKEALGFRVPLYGFDQWKKLFTPRQLLALGTFVVATRKAYGEMTVLRYSPEWIDAVSAYLVCGFDRMLDFNAATLSWITSVEAIGHTFVRFALPITWDYSEAVPINAVRGGWEMCLGAVMESQPILESAGIASPAAPRILKQSAVRPLDDGYYDAIVTDPPYYDSIPYSDLMDYFYTWQRRVLQGLSIAIDSTHSDPLSPKWDHENCDGELIDDSSRHDGDSTKSKQVYEDGMARVFIQCAEALRPEGRLVVVFANKQPKAWETLVSAIIRAGFVVGGSWPIQTEQAARMRAQASAALASSVWLIGKKRPPEARPGWDNQVLEEMRTNIATHLREFWDAGIRGPDFVWAATGPALEAYSKHPVVKKANDAGKTMDVSEFLSHVRRMVVDFVVGRVLTGGRDSVDLAAAERMDAPTAYYLLHRHDFGLEEAPSGACILYATACGMSDRELETKWDILVHAGGRGRSADEDEDEVADPDAEADAENASDSGSKVKLKTWAQRKHKSMGYEAPGGQPVPLIDRIHRLMHLWRAGDATKVDEYLDDHGLRRQELFRRLLQSLIELSPTGSDERTLLESLSNHVQAKGTKRVDPQVPMTFGEEV